jgi:DNA-binding CsgD family transcriptional regulator
MQELTQREIQILDHVHLGHTVSETASVLNISKSTVKRHRGNIIEKMKLGSTASLIAYALARPSLRQGANAVAWHTATLRETEVLHHIGLGLTNKEIGRLLGISHETVRKHRQNLARKLQVHGAHALMDHARTVRTTSSEA